MVRVVTTAHTVVWCDVGLTILNDDNKDAATVQTTGLSEQFFVQNFPLFLCGLLGTASKLPQQQQEQIPGDKPLRSLLVVVITTTTIVFPLMDLYFVLNVRFASSSRRRFKPNGSFSHYLLLSRLTVNCERSDND